MASEDRLDGARETEEKEQREEIRTKDNTHQTGPLSQLCGYISRQREKNSEVKKQLVAEQSLGGKGCPNIWADILQSRAIEPLSNATIKKT